MISLSSLTPQGQTKKGFIKNSLKQSIYFRQNYRRINSKTNSRDDKGNHFVKPYNSLPRENNLLKNQLKLQSIKPFVRSKTQVSMAQRPHKEKKIKYSPPKVSFLAQSRQRKKKRDPSLRLIAKTLVFTKSHKYYLYKKINRNTLQINPQPNIQKGSFFEKRTQSNKIIDNKLKKKYKLLELNGSKMNIQDFINTSQFNNSSIYLQSNSECYNN